MFKRIRNLWIGWFGGLLVAGIGATLRFRFHDPSKVLNDTDSSPIIFAFWHNQMLLMPYFYRKWLPKRQAVCLVSASQDGEMIARVLSKFGLKAARGSSSRKGREAYRSLVEHLEQGWDIGITPDGPRGPRYQAHPGVAGLAMYSKTRIVPMGYRLNWKIELPTWDRLMIPIPFSRCDFYIGTPSYIAEHDPLDEACEKIQNQLTELTSHSSEPATDAYRKGCPPEI